MRPGYWSPTDVIEDSVIDEDPMHADPLEILLAQEELKKRLENSSPDVLEELGLNNFIH
jgi:hypothetical protein